MNKGQETWSVKALYMISIGVSPNGGGKEHHEVRLQGLWGSNQGQVCHFKGDWKTLKEFLEEE